MSSIKFVLENGAYLPIRSHAYDAGIDLISPVDAVIPARGYVKIDLGVRVEIPTCFYGKLESRSGMMARGVTTMGGVIDSGYRGTIGVVLRNHNDYDAAIHRGDRVTQMVVMPYADVEIEQADGFEEETERGANGFGSTGD